MALHHDHQFKCKSAASALQDAYYLHKIKTWLCTYSGGFDFIRLFSYLLHSMYSISLFLIWTFQLRFVVEMTITQQKTSRCTNIFGDTIFYLYFDAFVAFVCCSRVGHTVSVPLAYYGELYNASETIYNDVMLFTLHKSFQESTIFLLFCVR